MTLSPAPWLALALLLGACSGSSKDTEPGTTDTSTPLTTTNTVDTTLDTGPTTVATPESAIWLETFDYQWDLFNHRLSYLSVLATDPPEVAVVGGTSTTGQPADLAPECKADEDSCREFPAYDDSLVTVGYGRITTTEASFAVATAQAVVPAGGTTVTLTAPAPDRSGSVSAVLQGFGLDTAHALSGGDACYKPEYGWHPRRIAVVLGEPTLTGDQLSVDVTMHFVAGNTEDPDRVCIDDVNEQAQVPMTATVLFVVGPEATDVPIARDATFAFSGNAFDPGEQVPPDPVPLGLSGEGIKGWSALDWTFNPGNAAERGAYLRTLVASIDGDEANGTATNFSPFTQLHDFSFTFEGTVTHVPLADATHDRVSGRLPTGVDASGRPVIYRLDGNTPTE